MSLDFYIKGGVCPTCGRCDDSFETNITHNLVPMAKQAGIYKCLWHPRENGYSFAHEIVPVLRDGIRLLKAQPDFFKQYNASNGWGMYEQFVPWVEAVLAACEANPDGQLDTST